MNQRLLEKRNPYLSINAKGIAQVSTPALEDKETEHISALLGKVGYVPILQVLSDINTATSVTHCFTHHAIKGVKSNPAMHVFFAGIIGLGCNIGIPKMAQISSGVNENTLNNVVNWYFSLANINKANDHIVDLIHRLALPNVFVAKQNNDHTSSDGRKVSVGVDSLVANYSFKYFGKDKGVSTYSEFKQASTEEQRITAACTNETKRPICQKSQYSWLHFNKKTHLTSSGVIVKI